MAPGALRDRRFGSGAREVDRLLPEADAEQDPQQSGASLKRARTPNGHGPTVRRHTHHPLT